MSKYFSPSYIVPKAFFILASIAVATGQFVVNLNRTLPVNVKALQEHIPDSYYRAPFTSAVSGALEASESIRRKSDSLAILTFDGKTEKNGFTEVSSHLSPEELAFLLNKVPEEVKNPLIEALTESNIKIPKIESREIEKREEAIKRKNEENIRKEKLLKNANKIVQKEVCGKFTSKDAYAIMPGRVGYTNSTSKKPILGTYGAGSSIIVAMYNPETKACALTHIDVSLDVKKTLENMISSIGNFGDQKLQIHLRGGSSGTKNQATDLLNYLSKRGDVEIKSCNLVTDLQYGASLAIDSRNGEIYTNFLANQLKAHPNQYELVEVGALRGELNIINGYLQPAEIQFDGRKEEHQKGKFKLKEEGRGSNGYSCTIV